MPFLIIDTGKFIGFLDFIQSFSRLDNSLYFSKTIILNLLVSVLLFSGWLPHLTFLVFILLILKDKSYVLIYVFMNFLCYLITAFYSLNYYDYFKNNFASTGSIVISVLLSGLFIHLLYSMIFLIAAIFYYITNLYFDHLIKSKYTDSIITITILEILASSEKLALNFNNDISTRKAILEKIEFVSKCIEHDLVKNLDTSDLSTDYWFKKITTQIASSFRSRKKWILLPKHDTHLYFTEYIENSLFFIANGYWDSVERLETEEVSFKISLAEKTLKFFKIFLNSGFLILVLICVQNSPLSIDKPISDYATLVSIVWAIFTILIWIDPLFNNKIDALKNITDFIPMPFKKS